MIGRQTTKLRHWIRHTPTSDIAMSVFAAGLAFVVCIGALALTLAK